MPDKKEETPEEKKKKAKKDNALRRYIMRVTGADKVKNPMDEAVAKNEAARKKDEDEKNKQKK